MRYLLSESSASILRDLVADRGGVSFEDRRIDRASPARPRPFACRVQSGAGEGGDETHMLCYLPPLVAEAVRWEDSALAPQTSPGSVDSPWVDLGAWDESKRVWLAIAPPERSSATSAFAGGWALVLAANPPTSLSGHAAYAHLVAAMESGTSGATRFVQYHLGSLLLAGGEEDCPDVYSVERQTGTLPACVAARYTFKRQRREKDATGNCIDSTGTGSSETTDIDVPAPDSYGLVGAAEAGGYRIDLTQTPCGGQPQVAASVTVPAASGFSGRVVTGLSSLAISGSALVLTYAWTDYTDGVATGSGTSNVSVPITSC